MKTNIKGAIVGVLVTLCVIFAFSLISSKAQPPILGGEQYKVISIIPYATESGQINTPALEDALNKLGEEGWRVRVFGVNAIILAK